MVPGHLEILERDAVILDRCRWARIYHEAVSNRDRNYMYGFYITWARTTCPLSDALGCIVRERSLVHAAPIHYNSAQYSVKIRAE